MYHKLYKRSAEKWQKVAILQKTQQKQKRQKSVYSSWTLMVHSNRKDAIPDLLFARSFSATVVKKENLWI